jgi:uncharacterized repeat protein (TIGR03803 family)
MKATILVLNLAFTLLAVQGQTFTTLHSFTATSSGTNSDGVTPFAGLVLSGNTLYGTAAGGGSAGGGTVFAVNTDGSGFTNLHDFVGALGDGALPFASLVLSSNTLYGTTARGGSSSSGTVFTINTDGAGFTNLYSFTTLSGFFSGTNSDGGSPYAGLNLSGHTLYGTAFSGGSSSNGTVFAVNTDGTGFTNLHSFSATDPSTLTNSDGANPFFGSLVLSGNTLYGTTFRGGSSGNGTVFAVNTDGTSFTTLHSFTPTGPNGTNIDGANPQSRLVLSGNTLYGTAVQGGASGRGTVFSLSTNGTGFTTLHSFTFGLDGADPYGGLIVSGNVLYGTAYYGGSSGNGFVFALNTDAAGFTNLYSFTATGQNRTNSDGTSPNAGLILSGNTLYGTAMFGGGSGKGTVFSLSFAPRLTINPFGDGVLLTWPTNYAGFDYAAFTLQSAPTISGPFTNVAGATSLYTNPITGAQQFFRLISN